jgi:hypothetical protein
MITFHIVFADVLFLLCLDNIDRLKVRFDNLENVLIQGNKQTPVVRSFGHLWILLDLIQALVYSEQILRTEFSVCHLTEIELRQLH